MEGQQGLAFTRSANHPGTMTWEIRVPLWCGPHLPSLEAMLWGWGAVCGLSVFLFPVKIGSSGGSGWGSAPVVLGWGSEEAAWHPKLGGPGEAQGEPNCLVTAGYRDALETQNPSPASVFQAEPRTWLSLTLHGSGRGPWGGSILAVSAGTDFFPSCCQGTPAGWRGHQDSGWGARRPGSSHLPALSRYFPLYLPLEVAGELMRS